ncbi:MAG TPA: glycosyltransferase 87 family protein [Acidimicrobiales bacterium]|nr:glycosyltransferase 87 family protein [Acidimicrobiales bacterium]
MRGVVLDRWRRVCALSPIVQDAWLYLASAVFAGATAFVAVSSDYRTWGQMAAAAYGAAAVACFVVGAALRRRVRTDSARAARAASVSRRLVVVLVIAGAVLVPLVFQLVWRAEGLPGQHAQPEVAVVERAGDRAAASRDPYPRDPTTVGNAPRSDAKQVDANSFFPYLPGMVPFGLVNAVKAPAELQDARVALTGFTLIVGAVALLWSDASLARRGRALQFLVVLPSGALPMVTGGDDLPVLALMLLGLVLAERRRPVLSGLALGLSGTLKFTAWPMLLLMLLAVRDREGRPAPVRFGLSVLLVVAPVFGIGVALDPTAFFDNVVRFPLGLARVRSPAASPLLGQELTNLLPHHKFAITALLVLVGMVVVVVSYVRYRPRTPATVARFTGFAMVVATILAPATRFGYLIYPANLYVWAYVLDGMGHARIASAGQSGSSSSSTVSETVLVGAPPPSAGVIAAAAGVTTIPASQ